MDDVILEEDVEMIWNGEFVPHVLIPVDDEELDSLIKSLGY